MPLTKEQIDVFKKRLEELRKTILLKLEGVSQEVKNPDEGSGYSQHQADQGTDDFDMTVSLGINDTSYNLLKQVEHALQKIKEGSYGICDISGDEIPVARLEAIPYACMTVKAQEKLEKGLI